MDIVQKLHKFIDTFIPDSTLSEMNKSVVTMYRATGYFTIQDDNVLVLGDQLPSDALDQQLDTAGKYVLMIGRGSYSYDLSYTLEKQKPTAIQSEVHNRALELVEANKNNVKAVIICIGINKTFASRPVYQATTQYQYVSKSEVKDINDIAVMFKMEPDSSDVHTDKLICEICGFTDCQCISKTSAETSPFDLMIPLSKSSLINGLVYGVVYEPMTKDSHGDWTSDFEIENAAHNFLPKALSKGNTSWTDINHKDEVNEVEVVESYIAQVNFNFPNGEPVKKGSWVLVARVNNEDLRKSIEDGEITGYSLEGVGRKVDIEFEEKNIV
jgi:hypothetical protein